MSTWHEYRQYHQLMLGMIGTTFATPLWSQQVDSPSTPKPLPLCVAEQVTYDDNLFRLNPDVDIEQRLGSGAKRADTIFRTSLCANDDWQVGQQEFLFQGSIDDNRFRYNSLLNHTSGNANLLWNWRTADYWYGNLGGTYIHALSNFVNDRPLVKDLVDSSQYFGELNHDVGAFVSVTVGGKHAEASHDAEVRKVDNYTTNSGNAGITLTSLAGNYIGVSFQRTRAIYPIDVLINELPFNRDYQESIESLRFHYGMASKTVLYGSVGHVARDYINSADNGYAGGTWHVTLQWQPSDKAKVEFAGWQELTAYFDSAADHFVGRGGSIAPTWAPRDKLKFTAIAAWERQQYLLREFVAPDAVQREDKVQSAAIEAQYSPVDWFDITINYRYEQHDSTLPFYGYQDRIAGLRLRGKF